MINHAFLRSTLAALNVDPVAVIANLRVIPCPLCPGDDRYNVAGFYDHAYDHTFGDIHAWAHRARAAFRVNPATGRWEWECSCSAQAYDLVGATSAQVNHAGHECPDCLGCRIREAVQSL